MAVRVDPKSVQLTVPTHPKVSDPVLDAPTASMLFDSTEIDAAGQVTLLGDANDSAAGWKLGFIQAQWIETNWGMYRGQTDGDGSIFIQNARPPARPAQACLDVVDKSPIQDFFYNSITPGATDDAWQGDVFPLTLQATHYDKPRDYYALTELNSKTKKANYLSEVQLEFHFCTILALRDARATFHHQKAFYWNVRWQYTFTPGNFSATPLSMRWNPKKVSDGTGQAVSHVYTGSPLDNRFTEVITKRQTKSCNGVVADVMNAGGNRHESATWTSFDVTKP